MPQTTRWGIRYPAGSDAPDVPLWMQRMAADLDNVAKDDQGVLAARPAAGKQGQWFKATDTDQLFRDTGISFDEVALLNAKFKQYMEVGRQAGVLAPGDGAVSWINASTIRIAAGSGLVKTGGRLKPVTWSQTDVNVPSATANTRFDRIIVDGNGTVSRVAGTQTAGTTLDNATGATAQPGDTLQLANALAGTTGVANSSSGFRDRRPWAGGAAGSVFSSSSIAPAAAGTGGAWIPMPDTLRRFELTDDQIIILDGVATFSTTPSAGNTLLQAVFMLNGGGGGATGQFQQTSTAATGSNLVSAAMFALWQPGAGSHVVEMRGRTVAGTAQGISGSYSYQIVSVSSLANNGTA